MVYIPIFCTIANFTGFFLSFSNLSCSAILVWVSCSCSCLGGSSLCLSSCVWWEWRNAASNSRPSRKLLRSLSWELKNRNVIWAWTHPPEQNCRLFADDIFRCIFLNEKCCILIEISPKFVPKGSIDNNPAPVQIMAWRLIGEKPLSEPMLIWFTYTYICGTRWRWVNQLNGPREIWMKV